MSPALFEIFFKYNYRHNKSIETITTIHIQHKDDKPNFNVFNGTITSVRIHPKYPRSRLNDSDLNDIALVRLTHELDFSQNKLINSVCLPNKNMINTDFELAVASGWGFQDVGGMTSTIPQMGWLRIDGYQQNQSNLFNKELIYAWNVFFGYDGYILVKKTIICKVSFI